MIGAGWSGPGADAVDLDVEPSGPRGHVEKVRAGPSWGKKRSAISVWSSVRVTTAGTFPVSRSFDSSSTRTTSRFTGTPPSATTAGRA